MEKNTRKILVVEDDNSINEMIVIALKQEGYECVSAFSGTEALLWNKSEDFDLMILDLMLPGMTGEEVLLNAKKEKELPIIILSARDSIDDKVNLLSLGANDYMTKPFDLKELLVRVQVQLRSNVSKKGEDNKLSARELTLDLSDKLLYVNGNKVSLTAQELKILQLFMKNPGKVFSKNDIYEYAWDDYYIGEDKTVNVHISNLRKKIKEHTQEEYIETLWGLGFKFLAE